MGATSPDKQGVAREAKTFFNRKEREE